MFNLKFKALTAFKAMTAAVAPALLLTAACTKQPVEKADAPATKVEAPVAPPAAEVDTFVAQTDTAATAEFNKAVAAYVDDP